MIGLIEGRDVHYVDEGGTHNAAKVVLVVDASRHIVNLYVFPRVVGETGRVVENVPFFPSRTEQRTSRPNTFHWIERVEA